MDTIVKIGKVFINLTDKADAYFKQHIMIQIKFSLICIFFYFKV